MERVKGPDPFMEISSNVSLALATPPAVLQYVDSSSLDGGYQNFARLMEQRLAQLFVIAQQQGARFRRATTVGGYTVQVGWHSGGGKRGIFWGSV